MTHSPPAPVLDVPPALLGRVIAILERQLAEREAVLAELRPAIAPALELLDEDRRRRERLTPGDAI